MTRHLRLLCAALVLVLPALLPATASAQTFKLGTGKVSVSLDPFFILFLTAGYPMYPVAPASMTFNAPATRLALPVIMATGKFPLAEFTRRPWLRPAVTLLKPYTFDELVGAVQIVLLAAAGAGGEIAAPTNGPARA